MALLTQLQTRTEQEKALAARFRPTPSLTLLTQPQTRAEPEETVVRPTVCHPSLREQVKVYNVQLETKAVDTFLNHLSHLLHLCDLFV